MPERFDCRDAFAGALESLAARDPGSFTRDGSFSHGDAHTMYLSPRSLPN